MADLQLRKLDRVTIGAGSAELMLLIAAYLGQKGYELAPNLSAGNVTPFKRDYKVFRIRVSGNRVTWVGDSGKVDNGFSSMEEFVGWMELEKKTVIGDYDVSFGGTTVKVGCMSFTVKEALETIELINRARPFITNRASVNGVSIELSRGGIIVDGIDFDECTSIAPLLIPEASKMVKEADEINTLLGGNSITIAESFISWEGEGILLEDFDELTEWLRSVAPESFPVEPKKPARKKTAKKRR